MPALEFFNFGALLQDCLKIHYAHALNIAVHGKVSTKGRGRWKVPKLIVARDARPTLAMQESLANIGISMAKEG